MPNQNSNATITDLLRQHGEVLVKLTTLTDSHEKRLEKQEEALDVIAKAVARREVRDEFWEKFFKIVLPFLTTIAGVLAGHFIR